MKLPITITLISFWLFGCNGPSKQETLGMPNENKQSISEPWQPNQLMPPGDLARMIEQNSPDLPVIVSIGPDGLIKGSLSMGPASEEEHLAEFKSYLEKQPKDQKLVIYCGCCPFSPCPNVRPAFTLLNEMGFSNHGLLNLETNLKTDWIDHGYPITE